MILVYEYSILRAVAKQHEQTLTYSPLSTDNINPGSSLGCSCPQDWQYQVSSELEWIRPYLPPPHLVQDPVLIFLYGSFLLAGLFGITYLSRATIFEIQSKAFLTTIFRP
jgi:hypothetical protein